MKKRIILLVVVLSAAGLGYVLWSKRPQDDGKIRMSGNMELTEVDLSFKVPGKLVELTVKEGMRVKKGQLIARIDSAQTAQQRQREQAGVQSAAAMVSQMATAIEWQRATLEGELALRRAEVQQAEANLANLVAGSRPQEIQTAEAARADARGQYDLAREDWERAERLYKNDDISAAQHDQARTRFNTASGALKQAESRLSMVREGPRKEEIAAARAALARTQAALKISEANRMEIQRKEQEMNTRRAEVARAQAQLGVVEAQLADTILYAPIDGVVLVKPAEPGEVLAAGTTVVTIGDLEHPWLRGYVKETDLGRVKLGQKVRLRTDSFPGKDYWGTITFIASEAEFTPKQIQTQEERVKLVYRLKIEVENSHQELKSNMPVDAVVEI